MAIEIPCNPCSNGTCGNCVAEKLETMKFINSAKYHCSCAHNGHTNQISKKLPNKTVFSSKKDAEPFHPREIQTDSDGDFRNDE